MSRYRFVSTMKAEGFPVDAACEAAEVSTSAYYEWLQRAAGPTEAELDEAYLINHIQDIHADSDATYGSPRVTGELRRRGYCVNHKRTERLMAENAIVGVTPPAPDTSNDHGRRRGPAAARPRQPGLLSGRAGPAVGGRHHLHRHRRGLALPGLGARSGQSPPGGLGHGRNHADRAGGRCSPTGNRTPGRRHHRRHLPLGPRRQYLSAEYRELCDKLGIRQSAGRVATCFDNSAAESFWSSLKRELVHRYRFATRADAIAAINAWIRRYNNVRLHSTLGYVPPIEWELRYRLTQQQAA